MALFLDRSVISDENDLISHELVEKIKYPICRLRTSYFDLLQLMKWVQEKGTDPLTRQPIEWGDYEAVNIDRGNADYRTATRILTLLKNKCDARHDDTVLFQDYDSFRLRMANYMKTGAVNTIPWLVDYWIYHPYDPHIDQPNVGFVLPTEFHHSTVPSVDRTLQTCFRYGMAVNIRYGEYVIMLYWRFHPISHDTNIDYEHILNTYDIYNDMRLRSALLLQEGL